MERTHYKDMNTNSRQVYLAGSIEKAGKFGKIWRDNAKQKLNQLGYKAFHPYEEEQTILQKHGYQTQQEFIKDKLDNLDNYCKCMRELEIFDIAHLANSDVVLVYLDGTISGGTPGELTLALDMLKPVVAVIDYSELENIPGWCLGACNWRFDNFEEAINKVDEILKDKS